MDPGDYIYIRDGQEVPAKLLSIPLKYERYVDRVLVNSGLLQDRVEKLALDICKAYENDSLTFLVVLKGASRFARDLVEGIDKAHGSVVYSLEFIRVKSYENDEQHEIRIDNIEKIPITGRNIVIVEDLVDSGKTLHALKRELLGKSPKSLKITSLFFKRNLENTRIMPDFLGFSIPNEWIVGYNMDYNEKFRDLSHVGILNDLGKEELRVRSS